MGGADRLVKTKESTRDVEMTDETHGKQIEQPD